METRIVSVRVNDIRPKYNNLEEWMKDPNNLYIGRGRIVIIEGKRFPPSDSLLANKFKVVKDGTIDQVLDLYRKDL